MRKPKDFQMFEGQLKMNVSTVLYESFFRPNFITHYYLEDLKDVHKWLGQAIKYLEEKKR